MEYAGSTTDLGSVRPSSILGTPTICKIKTGFLYSVFILLCTGWTIANCLAIVRESKAGAMFQLQLVIETARQDLKLNYWKIIQVLDDSLPAGRQVGTPTNIYKIQQEWYFVL